MSRRAKEFDAQVRRRAEQLERKAAKDDARPAFAQVASDLVAPAWMKRVAELDATAGAAWDERDRRIAAGSATADDVRQHRFAREALEAGRPLPAECAAMPGPELPRSQRTWHPDEPDSPQRAVGWGIPPLIAEEIARGDGRETKSTRACAKVGVDYMMLVLIGERGCGKTYAAARWLWRTDHARFAPRAIQRRLQARRFLEAPELADVEFADRPRLGECSGLVLDDLGTEKDFLRADLARLLVTRYRNALPTVVTTNLSEADLVEIYGARFGDRMAEVGKFVVVSNDPRDSLRGK